MVTINLSQIKKKENKLKNNKKKKNQDIKNNCLFLMDLLSIELIELEFCFKIYHKKIWFISWTRKCQRSWESIKTLKEKEMSFLISIINIWNMILRRTWIKKLEKPCQRELLRHLKISMITKKELRFYWIKANKQMRILLHCKMRPFKWELTRMKVLINQWMNQKRTFNSLISKMPRNKLLDSNYMKCRQSWEICKSIMNLKMLTTLTSKTYWNSKKN